MGKAVDHQLGPADHVVLLCGPRHPLVAHGDMHEPGVTVGEPDSKMAIMPS